MLKRKSNLNGQILKYFLIFSIMIIVFLWLLQIVFLDSFYKHEKITDIKNVAQKIKSYYSYSDFNSMIDDLSVEEEVCVEITNDTYSIFETSFFGKGCMRDENELRKYKRLFINSNKVEAAYEIYNSTFKNRNYLYSIKLNNNEYAFINASIEPIDSTASILKKQLFLVAFIVLCLAFIISFFIAKHLSTPIIKLNNQAKNLSNSNFNFKFNDNSNILELNELSNTLNYAKDELSKTEKLRRDLLANVSHDLKTPLTMIKAYTEMSIDLHSNNKKKRREDANVIISEVDRLTLLVDDILELSKMQSNIYDLKYERFNLIELINNILSKYVVYQELNNYKFIFNYNIENINIKADKSKIEQVIYNLINNAINYTGDDNLITINVLKQKEEILIEIIDTGGGINQNDIPYIWDRYYKNKMNHKREVVGTGLGLSIVKNILELHKYEYGVKSNNKGSNFYFIIK